MKLISIISSFLSFFEGDADRDDGFLKDIRYRIHAYIKHVKAMTSQVVWNLYQSLSTPPIIGPIIHPLACAP
jgi:hypothetical protein